MQTVDAVQPVGQNSTWIQRHAEADWPWTVGCSGWSPQGRIQPRGTPSRRILQRRKFCRSTGSGPRAGPVPWGRRNDATWPG